VNAVIPLLLEHGSTVTSKQMAEAAGIAEGTIFRVFADKRAVIKAAIETSMDPAPVCDAITDIAQSAHIETQLEAVAAILLERSERVGALHGILRTMRASTGRPPRGVPSFVRESNAAILAGLIHLLERHAERLRVSPTRAAIAVRGLVFANAYPMVAPNERMTPREIVDLLMSGIVEQDRPT